jgi:hypothetical protein
MTYQILLTKANELSSCVKNLLPSYAKGQSLPNKKLMENPSIACLTSQNQEEEQHTAASYKDRHEEHPKLAIFI